MTGRPLGSELNGSVQRAYLAAIEQHGDLGLEPEYYSDHLLLVCKKYVGEGLTADNALVFINGLHTDDVYLAVACALHFNDAWERFTLLYQSFIRKVAVRVSSTADAAREIADSIPGYIFLPGASGTSRIASYEGRSSLAAWLSAVVNNFAIKEQRHCTLSDGLDSVSDIPDRGSAERLESTVMASRYTSLIYDAIATSGKCLNDRERLILSLKYGDGLSGSEIAETIGVHPATVSRHLHQIYGKLHARAEAALAATSHLPQSAITECLAGVCENPGHFILDALRECFESLPARRAELAGPQ